MSSLVQHDLPQLLALLFSSPLFVSLAVYLYRVFVALLPHNLRLVVQDAATVAVRAVEQLHASQQLPSDARMNTAVDIAKKDLGLFGLFVPRAVIQNFAEAAVLELNQLLKDHAPPDPSAASAALHAAKRAKKLADPAPIVAAPADPPAAAAA